MRKRLDSEECPRSRSIGGNCRRQSESNSYFRASSLLPLFTLQVDAGILDAGTSNTILHTHFETLSP